MISLVPGVKINKSFDFMLILSISVTKGYPNILKDGINRVKLHKKQFPWEMMWMLLNCKDCHHTMHTWKNDFVFFNKRVWSQSAKNVENYFEP